MGKEEIIRLAHSPDSDDAFMFYGLATGKVDTGNYRFVHELHDIETLNQAALEGRYEVTAISIHAFAYLHDRYSLLNSGASMGEGYGPKIVGRQPKQLQQLTEEAVLVPGDRTSACLALKLALPGVETCVLPFDQIIAAVSDGKAKAGVIIHEGQLFYREHGLHQILDLGVWWNNETGLPLPLGGNVIRKDLGPEKTRRISHLIRESIEFSIQHREEALAYALQYGRGLDAGQGDRFVSMYVNQRTLDYGEDGRRAVQLFLDRGFEAGLIPHRVIVDFVV
jgi:1,4-dihydroxy-6-naphthoate synthase